MTITRRNFLKGMLSVSATAAIGPSLLVAATDAKAHELLDGVWRTTGSHWGLCVPV